MGIKYEIERYEVHLYVRGSDLGGHNYFATEEEAVSYAKRYVQEHPDWTSSVFRVERAIIVGA